ncbi:hypothetical protein E4U42_003791 [Claviceps africana]|uniref:tRNA(Phe) 7-[(3-amino-3-carboxypropyl)-4-demethylwyosine(37)-N(4)]-methyltransferase n=1 Tax=Claviceps africana TaxID=83212 RepID=A0A8K0NIK5_9HYPO|nr:hypothetical protein E4U42_003791 [Claviceps africana]
MHHHRDPFPKPSAGFAAKKTKILDQLAVPEAEYTDASPKGTIDAGIRELIDEINAAEGFVTTSSCAGRVSVFLEGRKAAGERTGDGDGDDERARAEGGGSRSQVARVGGKGAGGTWLFVSHDVVEGEEWMARLAFGGEGDGDGDGDGGGGGMEGKRLIHFKFEPMILHILTASPLHAQALLQAALQAGFRESGALNITPQPDSSTTPLVAIRSMGLSFESLIGYEANGTRHPLVTGPYLRTLMGVARERFAENAKRIARFRGGFAAAVVAPRGSIRPDGKHWEDGAVRRERMREEGLRRREALEAGRASWKRAEDEDEDEGPFHLDG